eukprot:m.126016 g.126016  ORF g.126016 m.126016 type:complete len:388 (-) comp14507_c1_seq3:1785-2948(-)
MVDIAQVTKSCILTAEITNDPADKVLEDITNTWEASPFTSDFVAALSKLIRLFQDENKTITIVPLLRDIVKETEVRNGVKDQQYGAILLEVGQCLGSVDKLEEATSLLEKAVEALKMTLGEHHVDFAHALNSLAGLYTRQGRFSDAKPLTEQSLNIFSESLLAEVRVKNLDTGQQFPLSHALEREEVKKVLDPIELHPPEEVLQTCIVRNLDTGKDATLDALSAVAPEEPESPMILRDVEDVLATITIRNMDTGELTTLDRASGSIVPENFAPKTRRASSVSNNSDSKDSPGGFFRLRRGRTGSNRSNRSNSSTRSNDSNKRSPHAKRRSSLATSSPTTQPQSPSKPHSVGPRVQSFPNATLKPEDVPAYVYQPDDDGEEPEEYVGD